MNPVSWIAPIPPNATNGYFYGCDTFQWCAVDLISKITVLFLNKKKHTTSRYFLLPNSFYVNVNFKTLLILQITAFTKKKSSRFLFLF